MSNILNIKFENHKIPEFKEVKNKDWVYFGEENDYPEYLIEQALRSAKHGAILSGKVNYIYGGGLHVVDKGSSLSAKAQANKFIKQLNDDNFIRKMIQDFEWFNGFYIEPILTKGGKLSSINYIPFSKIRVSADEKKLYYSNDWRNERGTQPEKTGFKEFDAFDFENPKSGALFYYKIISPKNGKDRNVYPVPEYVGANASIETDIEIANYHLNNIKTGFAVGTIVNFNNGIPEDTAKDKIEKMLKAKFQGTDRAGSVAISFNNSADNAPTITSFTPSDLDKQFIEISKRVEQDIFTGHKITNPALFGVNATGVVFQRNDLIDSFELFQNTYIDLRQKALEQVINDFASFNNVSAKIEFKRVQAVQKSIPDSVLQRVYDAYPVDQLAEIVGLPPIKRVQPVLMSKQDEEDIFEVLFEMDFTGQNEDEILNSYKLEFASELSSNERSIIDLLSKDSLTPTSAIAKALNISEKDVNNIISSLDEGGYLEGGEPTTKGIDVVEEDGAKTELTEIRYKYTWRPGVTPDKENSRDFCKKWLDKTEGQKNWLTTTEIFALDNGQDLPVWDSRGGWWNKGNANVPFCRHIWKAMVVRRK